MFTLPPSQVIPMTWHIWRNCSLASTFLFWSVTMSSVGLPFQAPPLSVHSWGLWLARAQPDLFECSKRSGKLNWWDQGAEALGGNILQGSVHEEAGKACNTLAARPLPFAVSSSDVYTAAPGAAAVVPVMATPWPPKSWARALWEF